MDKRPGKQQGHIDAVDATNSNPADKDNPGQVTTIKVEQRQKQTGKYGSVPVQPFTPPTNTSNSTTTTAAATSDPTAAATNTAATAGSGEPAKDDKTQPATSWVEVELVDEDNQPIAGEAYRVTLPDGKVDEGTLDQNGYARLEGFAPGTCQITFPAMDAALWEAI